jgi:hypothetical protein
MKPLRNSRAVLMELMIIVLFFALSSVIIVRLFAAAHQTSSQSAESAKLLQAAQTWADRLRASDDFTAELRDNGWNPAEGGFMLAAGGGALSVTGLREEEGLRGSLSACELSASILGREIFVLPIARYMPEGEP